MYVFACMCACVCVCPPPSNMQIKKNHESFAQTKARTNFPHAAEANEVRPVDTNGLELLRDRQNKSKRRMCVEHWTHCSKEEQPRQAKITNKSNKATGQCGGATQLEWWRCSRAKGRR